ncbi:hypothetical protein [Pyrodictium occultum]|nr:hypothetical protein [Pyrodictium occultum]
MEQLAGEDLDEKHSKALKTLRRNLYAYLSRKGAEWTEVDEETGGFNILLPGTYEDAARALQALWLSLHLVYMVSSREPSVWPEATEVYEIHRSYLEVIEHIGVRQLTFKQANQIVETASYIALLSTPLFPELFELLALDKPVAVVLHALSLYSS